MRTVFALLVLATPRIGPPPNVGPLKPEPELESALEDDDPGEFEAPAASPEDELPDDELPNDGLPALPLGFCSPPDCAPIPPSPPCSPPNPPCAAPSPLCPGSPL